MKYFLSSFYSSNGSGGSGGFGGSNGSGRGLALGIPSEAAASLLYFSGEMGGPVEEDEDEQRFSLPHFFGFGGEKIRHGIILKGEGKRRVLLLTAVEREAEFSPESCSPPPLLGALGGFLRGLCFRTLDAGDSFPLLLPLLLIDPFKLVDGMIGRNKPVYKKPDRSDLCSMS
jgi:hypothetical protein